LKFRTVFIRTYKQDNNVQLTLRLTQTLDNVHIRAPKPVESAADILLGTLHPCLWLPWMELVLCQKQASGSMDDSVYACKHHDLIILREVKVVLSWTGSRLPQNKV